MAVLPPEVNTAANGCVCIGMEHASHLTRAMSIANFIAEGKFCDPRSPDFSPIGARCMPEERWTDLHVMSLRVGPVTLRPEHVVLAKLTVFGTGHALCIGLDQLPLSLQYALSCEFDLDTEVH